MTVCVPPPPSTLDRLVRGLMERSILGFAWADAGQIVRGHCGTLATFITRDAPLCSPGTPFFGLERDILALQDEDGAALSIPKIDLVDRGLPPGKLSIDVHWCEADDAYIVVLHRSDARTGVEDELTRQIRSRRLAEDNLERAKGQVVEKQNLLDVLIANAPVSLAILDADGRVVVATRHFTESFRFLTEPILGESLNGLFPYLADRHEDWLVACRMGRATATDIHLARSRTGVEHHVRWHHWPWRGVNGAVGGIISFAEILTDMVERNAALQDRNRLLARANADLEEFASLIAHDLRAPLRSLGSGLEWLREQMPEHESAMREHIGRLEDQIERMAAMLSELLDYARLKQTAHVRAPLDVVAMAEDVARTIPAASRFALQLDCEPRLIFAAPALMDLVFRNLIGNAVRHHDRADGVIEVRLREDGSMYRIEVRDDGPGMPRDRAADPFRPALSHDHGGHGPCRGGLGLALVKKMLENEGGRIVLASSGRGTRIEVCLPKPGPPGRQVRER